MSVGKFYPVGELMITEAPALLSTLSENVERLRLDLENIQRELDQALDVWRVTLVKEKQEFQTQLQNQQQTWNEEDRQWQLQREAYEQKIHDLQKAFDDQIALTEQNALRALNELDDSWQRDKLHWQQESSQRVRDLESREAGWTAERQKQESTLQDLQNRLAELDVRSRLQETDFNEKQEAWNQLRTSYEGRIQDLESSLKAAAEKPPVLDVSTIEELKAAWDREKTVWQQSLYDNILQLTEREAQWSAEREKQDRFLHKLQGQVVELQGLLAGVESQKAFSETFVDTYMQSLESEIAILNEMITQMCAPRPQPTLVGHPMRRKTDLPYAFR